jgi:hypothetical protein
VFQTETSIVADGTQILNVRQFRRIKSHPVESDEDSSPESISDTTKWLNWNCNMHNPHDCADDCSAEDEYDTEQNSGFEDLECPEQQDVNATPNFPPLVRPTWKSKLLAE